jgi:hypothetical protein
MLRKTPVALFSYNRPNHTERVLTALARSRRLSECDFVFYLDGAKSQSQQCQVDATRSRLHAWAPTFAAQIVERKENLGLARSVVSGVSELCESYGRVIVVEDDLVLSPDFLHFMIESLDHYERIPGVLQVGGCTLCSPRSISTDAFLLPVTTTWGWATWSRAWRFFDWNPHGIEDLKGDPEWLDRFNVGGSCNYMQMLDERLTGQNDSWGILWWCAVARQRGLVVYPANSLVWNGGFDGSGVHCGAGDSFGQAEYERICNRHLPDILKFPDSMDFLPAHIQELKTYFEIVGAKSSSQQEGLLVPLRKRVGNVLRSLYDALR